MNATDGALPRTPERRRERKRIFGPGGSGKSQNSTVVENTEGRVSGDERAGTSKEAEKMSDGSRLIIEYDGVRYVAKPDGLCVAGCYANISVKGQIPLVIEVERADQ